MKKLLVLLVVSMMLALSASAAFAQPYDAAMCDDGGTPTPCQSNNGFDVYDAINYVFTEAGYVAGTDAEHPDLAGNDDANGLRLFGPDKFWADLSDGTSSNFAAISITAGANNSIGVHKKTDGVIDGTTFMEVVKPQTGDTFLGGSADAGSPGNYPGGINPLSTENFAFALFSDSAPPRVDYYWSSNTALNSDGIDKMIAYYLPDLEGTTFNIDKNNDGTTDDTVTLSKDTYLLAWEDRPVGWSTIDWDYNDSVFLVTRITPVPEPMSMMLFGSGLVGFAAVRRRKVS